MSGEGLAEALAAAQARAADVSRSPPPPLSEAQAVAFLRNTALLFGHKPDPVVSSFLEGGPLADLVRTVIGAEVHRRRRRGRPRKRTETWLTFTRVVHLRRVGLTLEQAIAKVAIETDKPEATIRSQYERTVKDGARPELVPESPLAAVFADPRPES